MATRIGSLLIRLGLDSSEFKSGLSVSERELRKSVRSFERMGRDFQSFGAKLSVAVTAPMVALSTQAVQGFIEQQRAMADVTAALASMGNASGKTAAELGAMADKLELASLFDAEVILKQVTAQLLTFGNVAGREFDRAQQAAIDMATRLGTEPQSAAITLGKALNDPIKGITALTRVGVQFTEGQRAQIQAMTEAGNIAGAQGVILAEVERQFRGAAQAAADASPWRQAQVQIGQAMDKIGEAILPAIAPVAEAIAGLARAFTSLPEPAQKAIVVAAAIGAALGPLAIVAGSAISAMAPLLGAISAVGATGGVFAGLQAAVLGFGAAFGPFLGIAAAVAAVGILIYRNWDTISPVLEQLWATFSQVLGPPLQALIGEAQAVFTAFWNGPLGDLMRTAIAGILQFQVAYARVFGTALVGLLRVVIAIFTEVFRIIGDGVRLVSALLEGDWATAILAAGSIVNRIFGGMPARVIGWMQQMVTGIRQWISDQLGRIWDGAVRRIESVKRAFFDLYDAVVGNSYVPDMVDGIRDEMARLQAVMVNPAEKATQDTKQAFREMASEVSALLDRAFPQLAALRQLNAERAVLAQGQGAGLISADTASAASFRLGTAAQGLGEADVSAFLAGGNQVLGVVGHIEEAAQRMGQELAAALGPVPRTFSQIEQIGGLAFAELGNQLSGVLQGAQSLGDALRNLVGQLADLAINLAFRALGGSLGIPGFANGTLSAPRGLALVGEQGPELVSFSGGERVFDNSATRQMMGGGAGPITINISAPNERVGREAAGQAAMRLRQVLNGR